MKKQMLLSGFVCALFVLFSPNILLAQDKGGLYEISKTDFFCKNYFSYCWNPENDFFPGFKFVYDFQINLYAPQFGANRLTNESLRTVPKFGMNFAFYRNILGIELTFILPGILELDKNTKSPFADGSKFVDANVGGTLSMSFFNILSLGIGAVNIDDRGFVEGANKQDWDGFFIIGITPISVIQSVLGKSD